MRPCLRLGVAATLALAAVPAAAQVTAGYSEYFIPGPEGVIGSVLCSHGATVTPCPGGYDTHAVITVTAWSDDTTVYYDHWEDGLDFDPGNPATADETYTGAAALDTGDRVSFESANIVVPRTAATTCDRYRNGALIAAGTTTCYDGGDRIYVAGGVVTVTRVGWVEQRGVEVQGLAWEIYPIRPQLSTYIVPFGETAAGGNWYGFQRVAALVQATQDATSVTIDLDADGTPEITTTLDAGETYLLDRASAGGVMPAGAVITGSSTLQLKYITGRTDTNFVTRGFSAFPRGFWTTDYYAPLNQPSNPANTYTDYFLYNPHASPLTVDWESRSSSGTFTIAAGTTVSFRAATGVDVPTDSGLYFRGSDVFWGVGSNDAYNTGGAISTTGRAYEWGYSLLPSTMLYSEHYMGWAPDCDPVTAGCDYMGAFLTAAQDNTTVFVDFDSDGTADRTYILDRLETQFITDPDGDLSGARIWATGLFSLAYGQNADTSPTGAATPAALDLGYVAIPGTDFVSLVLGVDKSTSPTVVATAGSQPVTFTLRVSSGQYSVDGVTVTDTLPSGWTYQTGSTTITLADRSIVSADPTGGTGPVLTWSGLGNMAANQEITIVFTALTPSAGLVAGTLSQNRVQAVGTRTFAGVTQTFTTTDFVYVTAGSLQITKTSSVDPAVPVYPGDTITYTTTVTNPTGGPTLTGVSLYDALPAGVTMVSGTTLLSASSVGDRFGAASYATNAGSRAWAGNWAEADDASATTGDILITGGQLRLHGDGGVVRSIARGIALAGSGATWAQLEFDYATSDQADATDDVQVQFRLGGAGAWTTLATYSNGPTSGHASLALGVANALLEIRFAFPATGDFAGNNEFFYVDNLFVTYDRPVTGGDPPDLLASSFGYAIPAGRSLTATFQVTVDDPLPTGITSLTNTASTTSSELPIQVSASVTNIVSNPSVLSASVAGRVWLDSDGDGIQDLGEPGIANAEVTLRDLWGTPLGALFTDVGGRYLFPSVAPGLDYYVEVTAGLPAGVAQSFPNPLVYGSNRSIPFDLVSGGSWTTADLGYRPAPGTVIFGDQVWVDANANGLRDAGEVALAGATTDLFRDTNGDGVLDAAETTPVATTTSDASGHYVLSVSGLSGGEDYFVGIRSVTGYSLTTAGTYYFQNVVSGSAYLTADFGLAGATYAISDRVWFDMDGSQAPNGAESGIAGVSVDLLDASLNVIATAITAAEGTFSFSGVRNGNYTVRISDTSGVLVNHTGTTSWAIARQRAESVAGASVDRTASPSYGFRPTRSIGDTVFFDSNGSGGQDPGEGGIPGIVVELYQGATLLYTTTTDANGRYFFAGLADGSYVVSVAPLTGYAFTGTDAYPLPGLQLDAVIAVGASYWAADFGFQATTPRALSGAVWNDTDGDGAVDTGETGIGGVTLDVLSGATVVATVLTDAAGAYSVQGLAAGPYTVQLTDDNGVLTGLMATYEGVEGVAGVIDLQEPVDLADSDVGAVNFGYRPPEVTFANIASLKAYLEGGAAVVEWRTSLEIGTAGFHLYRLDPATGDWQRLNGRLLPGLVGHPEGGSYRFVDAGAPVTVGAPLSYVVEEVDVRGRAQAHGPYTVTLEDASSAASARSEGPGFGGTLRANRVGMASPLAALSGRSASSLAALVPSDAGWGATLADEREASAASAAAASAVAEAIAVERRLAAARAAAAGSSSLRGEPATSLSPSLQREPAAAGVFQQKSEPMSDAVLARERASALQQRAAAAARRVRRGGWVEVTTREGGAHYLTAEQIAGPAGLPATAVRGLILARRLAVSHRGRPVRYLPGAQGAGIYLYAEPAVGIYTDENVYQIGLGAGQAMGTAGTGFRGLRATSFQETVHLERDAFAVTSAIQDPEGDFWFWAYAFAGYEGLDTATVTVPARGVAGLGDASLRLQLAGGSDEPAEIDHRVIVSWNGTVVGESAWGGFGPHVIDVPLSAYDVLEGDNTLEVRAVKNAGVDMSLVYFDSVDLRYEREYRAADDTLAFGAPRGAAVEVRGFSSPDVLLLDVTSPRSPSVVAYTSAAAPDGYLIRFGSAGRGQAARYLALVRARAKTPVEVAASRLPSLASPRNRADYLLVVPDSLEKAAAALAEYRNASGLTTLVVPLAAIYSEFNGGIAEPTAVRKFLRYARSAWQTPPRYVTLVGRGTWDYKNVMGIGDNLMPPLLAASANGLFVSDVRLADLSGDDGIPEIAVGRLPVLTEQELLDYVAKIERQEGAPAGTWQRRVLMAADNPDQGGAFTSDSDAVASLLPADHAVEKVYLTATTPADARLAIRDALNAGVGVFNYIGHGGLDRLADENLWTSADTPSLVNADRLPFVLAMTCVAGNFGIPGYPSLGEAMTLKKDGGAVAFWGPTGLSENPLAVRLDKSFFEVVFVRNERVVGDATVRALGELPGLGAVPMRYMYNLLGEPVSRLPEGLAPVGP